MSAVPDLERPLAPALEPPGYAHRLCRGGIDGLVQEGLGGRYGEREVGAAHDLDQPGPGDSRRLGPFGLADDDASPG